jgi:outer membrane protein TolC
MDLLSLNSALSSTLGLPRIALAAILGLALCAGCAKERYRERADRETYDILAAKSAGVPNMDEDFTLDTKDETDPLADLPLIEMADPSLGAGDDAKAAAKVVSLEHALHVAVNRSRAYRNRKEALYLAALSLTLDRHRFTPIFGGGGEAGYGTSASDVTGPSDFSSALANGQTVIQTVEAVTGTPAQLLRAYADVVEEAGILAGADQPQTQLVRDQQVNGQTRLNMNVLLRGGGQLALGLTSNFLRFTTGDASAATSSVLSGSFTQPLWRGAGRAVAMERLTQAERNVLYAIRDFTQFRKDFVVEVCSAYYRVLQNRDAARNAWQSYVSFQKSVERERAFAQEGRRTVSALGRLEQAELDNQNQWINAVTNYYEALDEFKIQLGLSTDTAIVLDDVELDTLQERGLQHPEVEAADAVAVALAARLDLLNERERVEDATRQIKVAANALGADITLFADGRLASDGQDNFQELDFRRTSVDAGLDVDLPFDRKAERNAYRAALIEQERAARDYSLAEDTIKLRVRQGWRDLEQARRNYDVAKRSLELNQRRVEEQQLLSELGRATALDLVDAQNDLTQSQDNLTGALVAHTIARLQFWRDMGILYVKDNGQWEEVREYNGESI